MSRHLGHLPEGTEIVLRCIVGPTNPGGSVNVYFEGDAPDDVSNWSMNQSIPAHVVASVAGVGKPTRRQIRAAEFYAQWKARRAADAARKVTQA